jgi:hypothetical protein
MTADCAAFEPIFVVKTALAAPDGQSMARFVSCDFIVRHIMDAFSSKYVTAFTVTL